MTTRVFVRREHLREDLRNKTRVAISPSHMMLIVVDVFYRQQTLRTNDMSLIFDRFQFIRLYTHTHMDDASIFSLSFSFSHLFDAHWLTR